MVQTVSYGLIGMLQLGIFPTHCLLCRVNCNCRGWFDKGLHVQDDIIHGFGRPVVLQCFASIAVILPLYLMCSGQLELAKCCISLSSSAHFSSLSAQLTQASVPDG